MRRTTEMLLTDKRTAALSAATVFAVTFCGWWYFGGLQSGAFVTGRCVLCGRLRLLCVCVCVCVCFCVFSARLNAAQMVSVPYFNVVVMNPLCTLRCGKCRCVGCYSITLRTIC